MAYRVGSVVQRPIAPFEAYQREAEDQQLQQQDRQLRALTLQEAVEQRRAKVAEDQAKVQKEQARKAFLQEAVTKYRHDNGRPDLDALANAAIDFEPEWGMEIRKQVDTGRKTAADTEKLKFEHDATVAQASSNLLRASLKNPALYPEARTRIIALDPKADGHLPAEFDPQVLTQFADLADAYQTKSKGDVKAIDMLEQGRIDDWIGWRLEHAKSQEDVDEVFDDATARFDAATVRGLQQTYPTQFAPGFGEAVTAVRASRQQKNTAASDAKLGSPEDYIERKFGNNPTPQQVQQGLREHYNATHQPSGSTGGGGGGVPEGQKATVDAILKTPALYEQMTPTEKQKLIPALSAVGFDFDKALTKGGNKVGAIIGKIESLSKNINTSAGGIGSVISGTARSVAAKGQYDNEVSQYEALVTGMIPMVARAVGHTGVLTQQDVESVRALFPQVTDNKSLAELKLKTIKELIGGESTPTGRASGAGDPLGIRKGG